MAKGGFNELMKNLEVCHVIWEIFQQFDEDMSGFLEFDECREMLPMVIFKYNLREDKKGKIISGLLISLNLFFKI
jgi:hypothetical protein